jgi:hypothetical protein
LDPAAAAASFIYSLLTKGLDEDLSLSPLRGGKEKEFINFD